MKLVAQPAPQEILPLLASIFSVFVGSCTVFGSAIVAAPPVSGRVGLVSSCLFQPLQRPPGNGRESGRASQPQAVVLSLFQLGPVRHREPRPERREEPSGPLPWRFHFRLTHSL